MSIMQIWMPTSAGLVRKAGFPWLLVSSSDEKDQTNRRHNGISDGLEEVEELERPLVARVFRSSQIRFQQQVPCRSSCLLSGVHIYPLQSKMIYPP